MPATASPFKPRVYLRITRSSHCLDAPARRRPELGDEIRSRNERRLRLDFAVHSYRQPSLTLDSVCHNLPVPLIYPQTRYPRTLVTHCMQRKTAFNIKSKYNYRSNRQLSCLTILGRAIARQDSSTRFRGIVSFAVAIGIVLVLIFALRGAVSTQRSIPCKLHFTKCADTLSGAKDEIDSWLSSHPLQREASID